ncbi:hypothetical protein EX30DRAFT_396552 [Ascodesmis nigricans]|uniref:Uncharacterized protein n=1 Tax=Ascodesmis nigricans TaxID=341454 RepID=A0A4S2MUL9_9PEZI|nr:hypothetical protein EX30DRAFT_396552 [Ascodesmis nigricans]
MDRSLHTQIWGANASYWDNVLGPNGNNFYKHLVTPTALKLLAIPPPDAESTDNIEILELAYGNGIFSCDLISLNPNIRVFATGFSCAILRIARDRLDETDVESGLVEIREVDITSERDLSNLRYWPGPRVAFDRIVCKRVFAVKFALVTWQNLF